jgi:hypothetical protein
VLPPLASLACCQPRPRRTACSDPIAVYDYRPQSEPGICQITLLGRQKLNGQKRFLARNQNTKLRVNSIQRIIERRAAPRVALFAGMGDAQDRFDVPAWIMRSAPFAPFGLTDFQQINN